jgi:hypothetical protein
MPLRPFTVAHHGVTNIEFGARGTQPAVLDGSGPGRQKKQAASDVPLHRLFIIIRAALQPARPLYTATLIVLGTGTSPP